MNEAFRVGCSEAGIVLTMERRHLVCDHIADAVTREEGCQQSSHRQGDRTMSAAKFAVTEAQCTSTRTKKSLACVQLQFLPTAHMLLHKAGLLRATQRNTSRIWGATPTKKLSLLKLGWKRFTAHVLDDTSSCHNSRKFAEAPRISPNEDEI